MRARSLLSAPDIDGWRMKKLLQRIFLSSDPDNEDLKVLVYDCLYLPWLKGQFLPDFAPEYTGSYLIALQKPSGGIRGIAPVDIWRRSMGNALIGLFVDSEIVLSTSYGKTRVFINKTLSTETAYQQDLIKRDLLSTRLIRGKVGPGMWCGKFISTSNVLVCETKSEYVWVCQ